VKPDDRLNLVADLRDLQIEDSDGLNCGIVDDVEFEGKPGGPLALAAILVGPGAYRRRLPGWASWLVGKVAGNGVVKVPWREVKSIGSIVRLARPAKQLGLARSEAKAGRPIAWLGGGDAPD
jgi:sporulation protein YlmC with PRC-barrel domain